MDLELGKKKRKKMGLPAQTNKKEFMGSDIVNFITEQLRVSETMLAGLLDVTSRTVDNWKKSKYPDELTGKAKRIKALYEFVNLAINSKVKSLEMLSLLTESIDPKDEASRSPIYYIVEEPESKSFQEFSKLAIKNFMKQN